MAERDLRPVFKGWWQLGVLILAATTALWYVPAYLENGQVFVQKFFVEQNLQRFGGGDEAHKVPILAWPIYYPVILFVGLLPWSIWVFKPLKAALQLQTGPFPRYLARWAMVILIFFTISGTKLPHYILPAVPPLMMILAIQWAEMRPARWPAAAAVSVGYFALANVVFIAWFRLGGFAELDRDARLVNQVVTWRGTLFTYELARVANGKGLSLNETSNPSLGFYLDSRRIEFADTSSLPELEQDLRGVKGDIFVLSRPGRLSDSDLAALQKMGDRFVRWPDQRIGSKYMLYEVVPSAAAPTKQKGQPQKVAPETEPVRITSS